MFSEKIFAINSIIAIVLVTIEIIVGFPSSIKAIYVVLRAKKWKMLLVILLILLVLIPIAYCCFYMMFGTVWMIANFLLPDEEEILISIFTSMPNVLILFTIREMAKINKTEKSE